jgi:hypothetical protein
MFERPYLKSIISRIEEPRKFIQVILGLPATPPPYLTT